MTASALIRWYYRTRDSFGAPGMDFVDSTGLMYAKKCKHCGHKARRETSIGFWVCDNFKCGKPWSTLDCYIFKGEVKRAPRSDGFEHRNAKWIDVGTQLHLFMTDAKCRTSARVYIAYSRGFPITEISAANDSKLWLTEPGTGWSPRTVYRHKKAGHKEWVDRLQTAGILFDL